MRRQGSSQHGELPTPFQGCLRTANPPAPSRNQGCAWGAKAPFSSSSGLTVARGPAISRPAWAASPRPSGTPTGGVLVVAAGDLWSVDPETGAVEKLAVAVEGLWPVRQPEGYVMSTPKPTSAYC